MIFTDQSPIQFYEPLPESVDVVVIGGGVIGISTAWFLAKNGVSVLVCDKGRVAGEQSSRNWGWIRQQSRDPAELPIVIESINHWQSLSAEIGEDIGFTRQGVLYAAKNDKELAEHEKWMDVAMQHQLDTKMLSGDEVDKLIKDKPGQYKGAIFTPSDARAEPFKAVPALAAALRRKGGLIRENCAVRSLDVQAGRVTGVVTEHGRVAAQSVVCAGGAWSTMFLANLGIYLPQLSVRATVARTAPAPDIIKVMRRSEKSPSDVVKTVATPSLLVLKMNTSLALTVFDTFLSSCQHFTKVFALSNYDSAVTSFKECCQPDNGATMRSHRLSKPAS